MHKNHVDIVQCEPIDQGGESGGVEVGKATTNDLGDNMEAILL
jgi:hypothetical protein